MTKLEEIQARHGAASWGKWSWYYKASEYLEEGEELDFGPGGYDRDEKVFSGLSLASHCGQKEVNCSDEDAAFIVQAHNEDIPRLLERVDELAGLVRTAPMDVGSAAWGKTARSALAKLEEL